MQMNTSEKILSIQNLSVSYGQEDVVSNVSFDMKKGDILCIVGESGSGKSTLIKSIHGLENAQCTKGKMVLFGQEMKKNAQRRDLMGKEIGLIPQNPGGSFNPLRTFEKQFREAFNGNGMEYRRDKLISIFQKVGLKDGELILKSRPYEMSGGMNQRIAVAFAFAMEPKLLLCDEATSALDVTTSQLVLDELLSLRKEHDTAILMVTHHLGVAKAMADHVAIMKDGEMIEYGDTDSIFSAPRCKYTKNLIQDVPKLKKQDN